MSRTQLFQSSGPELFSPWGGAAQDELLLAQEAEWQEFNSQMIEAAREVIAAVDEKDEEALFTIGNDKLYPPCESCHQQYQTR